jgi:Domain of unknown function (DUF6471)
MKSEFDDDVGKRIARFLKKELKRNQGLSYKDLAHRMNEWGMNETEASISNKIKRGSLSASFLVLALWATGMRKVDLGKVFDS